MNNLNDPRRQNIGPDARGNCAGGADGNPWKYAPVFYMLGLAAFRWIWDKKSQREIQKVKAEHKEEVYKIKRSTEAETRQLLNHALDQEENWHQQATTALDELEDQLVERQHVYCSYTQLREHRLKMEQKMRLKVTEKPLRGQLYLESDLEDIFQRDTHCADLQNMNKRRNGSLMWLYLRFWRRQVTLQKHRRAEAAFLEGKG
ncbi:coiled-coil domain-containing protein 127-like [Scomber japonicus]|uniref:coiled-coil domain-containing protein 127-like n=1 Tax=Scomber japonicus TaxID=13676 RepID=UPI002304EAF5|nr:coiled-coil domain-containing protein 127-like [Scomber japonicus]